jgi:hypothetical protein
VKKVNKVKAPVGSPALARGRGKEVDGVKSTHRCPRHSCGSGDEAGEESEAGEGPSKDNSHCPDPEAANDRPPPPAA